LIKYQTYVITLKRCCLADRAHATWVVEHPDTSEHTVAPGQLLGVPGPGLAPAASVSFLLFMESDND